jgi:hypothetical protein
MTSPIGARRTAALERNPTGSDVGDSSRFGRWWGFWGMFNLQSEGILDLFWGVDGSAKDVTQQYLNVQRHSTEEMQIIRHQQM